MDNGVEADRVGVRAGSGADVDASDRWRSLGPIRRVGVMADMPAERHHDLATRVAALEVELALLQAAQAEQVRTRRMVVVDADGVERVIVDARHRTGSMLVRLAGQPGRTTGIEIYACETESGSPELGWCVIRDGEVVSRWTAG